jgi:hypothetical protein
VADFIHALYLGSSLVMAEQSVHDVVNQTMSAGEQSSADAYEATSIRYSTGGDVIAGEARTDIYEEERSEQDGQPPQTGSTSYPLEISQSHVGVCVIFPGRAFIECIQEQRESLSIPPGPADTFNQADSNAQDSDFDDNVSRNHSIGDLSAASDTDPRKVEPSSVSEDIKNQDAGNAGRRLASFKPVSFAKYSAAKVAGVNSAARSAADKGE